MHYIGHFTGGEIDGQTRELVDNKQVVLVYSPRYPKRGASESGFVRLVTHRYHRGPIQLVEGDTTHLVYQSKE